MFYPSEFVVKVLLIAEQVLTIKLEKNWLSTKYYFDFVKVKILNTFVQLYGAMLKDLYEHCYEIFKALVSSYVSIRFKSHARRKNELIKKKLCVLNCCELFYLTINKVLEYLVCFIMMR